MFKIYIYNHDDFSHYPVRGDDDDKTIIFEAELPTKKTLIAEWEYLLKEYEGWIYSVWYNDDLIVGGAFDPSDIDYIKDY